MVFPTKGVLLSCENPSNDIYFFLPIKNQFRYSLSCFTTSQEMSPYFTVKSIPSACALGAPTFHITLHHFPSKLFWMSQLVLVGQPNWIFNEHRETFHVQHRWTWRQPHSVRLCAYVILHGETQTFNCRNEKRKEKKILLLSRLTSLEWKVHNNWADTWKLLIMD